MTRRFAEPYRKRSTSELPRNNRATDLHAVNESQRNSDRYSQLEEFQGNAEYNDNSCGLDRTSCGLASNTCPHIPLTFHQSFKSHEDQNNVNRGSKRETLSVPPKVKQGRSTFSVFVIVIAKLQEPPSTTKTLTP